MYCLVYDHLFHSLLKVVPDLKSILTLVVFGGKQGSREAETCSLEFLIRILRKEQFQLPYTSNFQQLLLENSLSFEMVSRNRCPISTTYRFLTLMNIHERIGKQQCFEKSAKQSLLQKYYIYVLIHIWFLLLHTNNTLVELNPLILQSRTKLFPSFPRSA